MTISEEAVFEKLKNVIDPELFVNVVDLGLIYEVKLKPGATVPSGTVPPAPGAPSSAPEAVAPGPKDAIPAEPGQAADDVQPPAAQSAAPPPTDPGPTTDVHIEMTMTSPACPAGPQLISGAKREVATLNGVGNVEVKIVLDPPWTPDRMTEEAKDQLGIF